MSKVYSFKNIGVKDVFLSVLPLDIVNADGHLLSCHLKITRKTQTFGLVVLL
jgi:hypothetical protein